MSNNFDQRGSESTQFGTFLLGTEVFGVDILKMREIIRLVEITKVPRAESFIEGVINLRGKVIPVVNLRSRFKKPPKDFDKDTRIINIEIEDTVIGFIVDAIGHVRYLPTSSIEQAPVVASSVDTEYIAGVANADDQIFIILNVDKLISVEAMKNLLQNVS